MGWARLAPVRAVRECVQVVGVKPVVRKELSVEVYGLDELRLLDGPALIMANHASHLDTAVLVSTLPAQRRRRTAVGGRVDRRSPSTHSQSSGMAMRSPAFQPHCWPRVGLSWCFPRVPVLATGSLARSGWA
jgi:hypothetical protein